MAGTTKFQMNVPTDLAPEIEKLVRQYIYKNNPEDQRVYVAIKTNPTKTLGQIKYLLETTEGISRSVAGIKKVADWCDLPYAE